MTNHLEAPPCPSPSLPAGSPALILLVEDDPRQRDTLATVLRSRGHQVATAGSGKEALTAARSLPVDVVLLDLGLPDIDGVDLCRHLRLELQCPIIVVTADALEDRLVDLLEVGADDYVLKPYSTRVLLARLGVALRHRLATAPLLEDEVLRCGGLIIDIPAHLVVIDGVAVDLIPRQFDLLTALVRNEGRVMTYSTLARVLWGLEATEDYRLQLRSVVSKLRRALGAGASTPSIVTEQHVGYRLVAPGR